MDMNKILQTQSALKRLFILKLERENKAELIEDFNACFSSRGKTKGFLKSSVKTWIQKAIHSAIMSNANAHKVGFGTVIMLSKEEKEIFMLINSVCETMNSVAGANVVGCLDKDRVALESLGVW